MALPIPPTTKQLEDRIKADVQREAANSNPYLPQSVLLALIIGFARRVYDFFKQLQLLVIEVFWDTCTGDSLERWAAIYGKTRLPATQATGSILATGVVGSIISAGAQLQNSAAELYTVDTAGTIATQTISVTSLTYSAGTVTAVLVTPILVGSNTLVTIAGASPAGYNGTFAPTQTDTDTFTYEVPTALGASSGTITATWLAASLAVTSVSYGQGVNASYNSPLTFTSPIAGVNNSAVADFNAIGGGTDIETDAELRARFLYRVQNPVANFNVAAITSQALSVAGVTKVWVQEITPYIGAVTIYFIRGNDLNIIPDGSEVTAVKNAILTIKPANTSDDDVIVAAPTPVATAFLFSALVPNTTTMQSSITANLAALFLDQTEVEVALTEDAYRAAIQNTFDTTTGAAVTSFALTTPSGDIGGGTAELPTLTTVTYP